MQATRDFAEEAAQLSAALKEKEQEVQHTGKPLLLESMPLNVQEPHRPVMRLQQTLSSSRHWPYPVKGCS